MRRVFTVSDDRTFLWMVAAMAAILLLLGASAAPALAVDNINIGDDIEYNGVCQNILGAMGNITQTQNGSAVAIHRERRDTSGAGVTSTVEASAASTATAEADETATAQAEETADASADAAVATPSADVVAQVAQEQGVSIAQVNECLNGAANNNNPLENGTANNDTTDDTDGEVGALTVTPHGKVLTASIPEQKVLADTGGMPLFGLAIIGLGLMGAGAALLRFGGWH